MNPELKSLIKWSKNHFSNTLPLTIIGYLLIITISATTKLLSIEFLAHVGKTGLSLFSLGCCYVIGKSLYLLVNAGIEKFGEG